MQPRCVASTPRETVATTGYYSRASWSPDGRAVVAHTQDEKLSTYIVSETLGQPGENDVDANHPEPQVLEPAYSLQAVPTIADYAVHPHFDVHDRQTTLGLIAQSETPIQLRNLLEDEQSFQGLSVAPEIPSYFLKGADRENHRDTTALVFASPSMFVASGTRLVATFDVERPGNTVTWIQTSVKCKHKSKVPRLFGPKGSIMALAIAPSQASDASHEMLAVGSNCGEIGLLPRAGQEAAAATFSVRQDAQKYGIGGSGITSCSWSPCGTYLYVSERKGQGVLMYDIRQTRSCLGACVGRLSDTNQRLDIDVTETRDGHALVAGGTDGCVLVWESPHRKSECIEADERWGMHEECVNSVAIDPYGEVLATCSGDEPALGAESLSSGNDSTDEASNSDVSSSSSSSSSDISMISSSTGTNITLDGRHPPDHSLKLWMFD